MLLVLAIVPLDDILAGSNVLSVLSSRVSFFCSLPVPLTLLRHYRLLDIGCVY